jgi:4-hydroxythreonine-4-phosphate dehydrogenase
MAGSRRSRLCPAPLAVTMGEPAGIGGEITLKAWAARRARSLPPFFVLDNPKRLAALARALGLDVPMREIAAPAEAAALFDTALPVLAQPLAAPVAPGRPDPAHAPAVLAAIARAVDLASSGAAAGVVTNPIHKQTLYAAGFRHPGHTEYLAALTRAPAPPVMMLACPGLRVVPATIHLPLAAVPAALDRAALVRLGATVAAALRADFGIEAPRLAFAGLNPHAGEGGALGREEIEIIAPAVAELCAQGIAARGPDPADSLFHAAARAGYDAAICMYHDQALIPLKTIDFAGGVNVTLGLPITRTSPDHGTAFDIAGTGRADPASLIAALALAGEIAARRQAAKAG